MRWKGSTGQEEFKTSRVESPVGSGGARKFHGVRSGVFRTPGSGRVGSGRAGSGRIGSGRFGSGRFGSVRVGSGRVRPTQNRHDPRELTP